MSCGGRNLIILGLGAIVVSMVSVSIALTVYHNSGDIYLDRSRPGFLPDKDEHKQSEDQEYKFSDDGKLDQDAMKRYLDEYEKLIAPLAEEEANFGAGTLGDGVIFND